MIKMGSYLKRIGKYIMPYELYKKFDVWARVLIKKDKEHKYRYAYFYSKKKSKQKYCIFRFSMPSYMIFAAGIQYIFAFRYAKSKGFIPVIDIEWEYDFYRHKLGKDNVWDYCFCQYISVEDALKKNYVLVEDLGMRDTWLNKMCLDINGVKDDHFLHTKQDNWREYYTKINKYIRGIWKFKPELLDKYKQECGCKIKKGDVVLGVALRETFSSDVYSKMKEASRNVYDQHPLGPGIKEVLEIVKEYMKKWNCNKIFLSTMYQESIELFQHEFDDKIVCIERKRRRLEDYTAMPDYWGMNDKEIYENRDPNNVTDYIIPYVEEVIGLSECDYLIAAKSSGSIAALAINGGKYQDILILPDKNQISRY